jgi:uncharacterized membrane protein
LAHESAIHGRVLFKKAKAAGFAFALHILNFHSEEGKIAFKPCNLSTLVNCAAGEKKENDQTEQEFPIHVTACVVVWHESIQP